MTSALTVYEFYVEAADLKGKPATLTIESAAVRPVFNPRAKKNEDRVVVTFHRALRKLCLNKTQAEALISLTGTDEIEKWSGAVVVLLPDRSPNGKDTIKVTAPGPAASTEKRSTENVSPGAEP